VSSPALDSLCDRHFASFVRALPAQPRPPPATRAGADEQLLHRDEAVWSDVPKPAPELQLATVIALVDFTRENGGTRIVPGSHRWPDRTLSPVEQFAQARPTAEQIAYAKCPPGPLWSTRAGQSMPEGQHHRDSPSRGAPQLLPGVAADRGKQLPSVPPAIAAKLPRQAQELLGYAVHDGISRGGGYLGMVSMQDPVELLGRDELQN